jgi:hypothetical protein
VPSSHLTIPSSLSLKSNFADPFVFHHHCGVLWQWKHSLIAVNSPLGTFFTPRTGSSHVLVFRWQLLSDALYRAQRVSYIA